MDDFSSAFIMTNAFVINSIPISIPMSLAFDSMLGQVLLQYPLALVFSKSTLVVWLAIVLAVSILASLFPAYRAMRMSIRETLAYE
jgi:putative ABC transport system permease protein